MHIGGEQTSDDEKKDTTPGDATAELSDHFLERNFIIFKVRTVPLDTTKVWISTGGEPASEPAIQGPHLPVYQWFEKFPGTFLSACGLNYNNSAFL